MSNDEDFDFDEWVTEGLGHHPSNSLAAPPSADKPILYEEDAESSEEDDPGGPDGLDWEDAEEDDETGVLDRKMPARAVQIDLGAVPTPNEKTTDESSPSVKRKRKRRNQISNRFLPSDMRAFLVHLSRAHLLCLTSALASVSKSCTDADAIAIIASLVPYQFIDLTSHPTVDSLRDFTTWLFPFLNDATKARVRRLRTNRSQGAPTVRRRLAKLSPASTPCLVPEANESPLIRYAKYLAAQYADNPQLFDAPDSESNLLPNQKVFFSLAMAHSFQWRTRLVQVLEPVRPVLDVDHPVLQSCADLFQRHSSATKRKRGSDRVAEAKPASTSTAWIEVLCTDPTVKSRFRWVPVDPIRRLFDSPNEIARHLQTPLAYVVGVEHKPDSKRLRVCDVTPRYANSMIAVLRHRGVHVGKKSSVDERKTWWAQTIRKINQGQRNRNGTTADQAVVLDDLPRETSEAVEVEMENAEREELNKLAEQETIPTSKAAFQSHPIYVIPSVLGKAEVLAPDANKRVCGVFKGQLIYKRSDVSTALTSKKWLYEGRKVKAAELRRPIKEVKARKKPASKSFKALKSYGVGSENDGSEQKRIRDVEAASSPLSDGKQLLYAVWQTEPWCPSLVGPNDKIPINEYRNVELALLNPGLVHIDQPGLAAVAKKLGIPYAPCLLGFEGHGGNRTPMIRGIVVHKHNERLIREAAVEWQNHEAEVNDAKRRKTVLSRWKRLMVGLLTKERLDIEYGGEDEEKKT
jgi:Rad4 beta-hairpin domain 3/Rad4 transglutaminase-like domain/Rad4 beta-hairpin domain 1/Rad4 beta-hairpin domain 2